MNAIYDIAHEASAGHRTDGGQQMRILAAAADPEVSRLIKSSMESTGHRVDAVEDGEAAWKALLAGAYDLIVTDHIMPKASGLALTRRMRVAHISLPVIVVSETLDAVDALRLSHDPWSRVDACVHKPLSAVELVEAVHAILPDMTLPDRR